VVFEGKRAHNALYLIMPHPLTPPTPFHRHRHNVCGNCGNCTAKLVDGKAQGSGTQPKDVCPCASELCVA